MWKPQRLNFICSREKNRGGLESDLWDSICPNMLGGFISRQNESYYCNVCSIESFPSDPNSEEIRNKSKLEVPDGLVEDYCIS
jgi:hypothetical protein